MKKIMRQNKMTDHEIKWNDRLWVKKNDPNNILYSQDFIFSEILNFIEKFLNCVNVAFDFSVVIIYRKINLV